MAMIDWMTDEALALVSVLASYVAMTIAMGFLPALQDQASHNTYRSDHGRLSFGARTIHVLSSFVGNKVKIRKL